MANMSYCRFRNTKMDLADCVYTLEDFVNEETEFDLSLEEINAAKRMRELCEEYIELFDELQEGGKL